MVLLGYWKIGVFSVLHNACTIPVRRSLLPDSDSVEFSDQENDKKYDIYECYENFRPLYFVN